MASSLRTGLIQLYGGTEKYAGINNSDPSVALEAQVTISFTGAGIRNLWLEELPGPWTSTCYTRGVACQVPDFYTSGATEKRALLANLQILTDGPHTLTLQVDPDSEGRKKNLSRLLWYQLPAVGLDSPEHRAS